VRFPRHWAKASAEATTAKGRVVKASCWRSSDASLEHARAAAADAAHRVARRLAAGDAVRLARYAYGDQPLREEVLDTIGGPERAVITRNAYGCRVLNAARVLFVDVDFPEPRPGAGLARGLRRLFGRDARADAPEPAARAKIEAWLAAHPDWGLRIYRTRAGLRLAATHALFDPSTPATWDAMTALGCDPLYLRLCRAQQSFRARLTPKPWRCGARVPPARFPFETAAEERTFQSWRADYDQRQRRFATCALVDSLGAVARDGEVDQILAVHDAETRVGSGLPLA
jgi:hypothetical protein